MSWMEPNLLWRSCDARQRCCQAGPDLDSAAVNVLPGRSVRSRFAGPAGALGQSYRLATGASHRFGKVSARQEVTGNRLSGTARTSVAEILRQRKDHAAGRLPQEGREH